jgi:signal transduction histidine kinase
MRTTPPSLSPSTGDSLRLPRWMTLLGRRSLLAALLISRLVAFVVAAAVGTSAIGALYLNPADALLVRVAFLGSLALAVLGSLLFGMWQGRRISRAWALPQRPLVAPLWNLAARDAICFANRQLRFEVWFVPLATLGQASLLLHLDHVETTVISQGALAALPAVAAFVIVSLFGVEPCLRPIVKKLLEEGARIDYRHMPLGSLGFRLRLCSSLIIVAVAILNALLARERAREIVSSPGDGFAALAMLESQAAAVTVVAFLAGVVSTGLVARSVSRRGVRMTKAMERAGGGVLSERLQPTGNDELDVLAHQFNAMVGKLDGHSRTIRVLNAELERKVQQRTGQLQDKIEELQAAQAKLVHSEKMASLGQLVAGVAHELNNSINAVYNGIQPLRGKLAKLEGMVTPLLADSQSETREGEGDDEGDESPASEAADAFAKIARLADVIENGASRTARIVSDLKTFSHPGAEEFAPFDLHAVLDMSLNLLANELRHRVTVHKDYGRIDELFGPRSQLSQVFLNIFSNALQAMTGHGELFIVTRQEADDVFISIRDTGCGIPAEIRDRIFDPFFTTKPPGVGTGLGLSISYGLLMKMGGAIECRSEPGGGAEFVIMLPRVAEECAAGELGNIPLQSPHAALVAAGYAVYEGATA